MPMTELDHRRQVRDRADVSGIDRPDRDRIRVLDQRRLQRRDRESCRQTHRRHRPQPAARPGEDRPARCRAARCDASSERPGSCRPARRSPAPALGSHGSTHPSSSGTSPHPMPRHPTPRPSPAPPRERVRRRARPRTGCHSSSTRPSDSDSPPAAPWCPGMMNGVCSVSAYAANASSRGACSRSQSSSHLATRSGPGRRGRARGRRRARSRTPRGTRRGCARCWPGTPPASADRPTAAAWRARRAP